MKFHSTLFAFSLILLSCSSKKTDEAKTSPSKKLITVDVIQLQPSDVALQLSIPGNVIPGEEVMIYSEVAGRIQSIPFKEGQLVKAGSVLLQVDTDILKAQRAKQLVLLELAKKDEARKKSLLNAKGISLEEYEKVASQLASTQAEIDLLNVQISKATIRAPFSGRIGLRKVSVGAFISPSTMITTLIQENPIKIEFSISEKYASAVRIGQSISFKIDGKRQLNTAKIYAYEPMINAETRMLTLRASLNNANGLIAGSYVDILYDLGNEVDAFMVPSESVIPILKGQKILVARNGKIEEIAVQLGLRTDSKVQVIGDLKKDDLVLVSGLLAARKDMPVQTKIVTR